MTMQIKSISTESIKFEIKADGSGFTGYASTFGNVDSYGDTIIKGAYLKTLATNGLPKMFFNHDRYAVPIGKWTKAVEDNYGLLVTGEFTPENTVAQEVKAALKHGTLDSMSIGYALTKGGYSDTEAGRTITEVLKLSEVSIVTFPADKYARVNLGSVKSLGEAYLDEIKGIESVRDFEFFLRDVGGFGKSAAQALTAHAKALFTARDVGQDDKEAQKMAELLVRLQKIGA